MRRESDLARDDTNWRRFYLLRMYLDNLMAEEEWHFSGRKEKGGDSP